MAGSVTTMEYDPFSPEFQADPFSVYRWMLEEAPVFHSEKWGWWALSRWEDVRAAALDAETFRSFEGIDIDDTAKDQSGPGFLPDIDNPRHDQIRQIIQPHFLPRRIATHEDDVRRVVRAMTKGWPGRSEIDVSQELSWPMPLEVFFDLIGLPAAREEGRDQLERWVHELKDRDPGDARLTPVAKAATEGIRNYFIQLLEERRRHPRQDVVSDIVQAEIDGVPFADEHITPASEVMGLMTVLFFGGAETTSGLTSTFFKLLAENPDQRELLRRDPSLIPNAAEEAVRYATPLQLVGRTTSREVTLHGVTIPKGGRVVLVYGAANRDPRQFENPDKFDVTRPRFRHLGFGEGVHGCVGRPLALLEVKVAAEELLPALGDYELSRPPVRYRSTPNAYVWEHLYISPSAQPAQPPVQPTAAERPKDLTVFYDPLSYAAYDHPYEVYRELRDRAPVYYNPRRDLWVLSRYEDVRASLKNHDQLVNTMGNDVDGTHDTYGPGQIIALDPPHHQRVRDVLGSSLAAGAIQAMEPQIRRVSRELLAGMREKGGGDFAVDFALPLVFDVSLRLLGIPGSEAGYFQDRLVRSMARTVGQLGLPDDAAASNREVEEHLGEILSRRRKENGVDANAPDVISQVLLAGQRGVLDEAEQAGLVHLLLSAATDVSAALLTNCLAVLDKFPGLQAYLHQNRSMASAFVEETLRYDSPMQNAARQTPAAITIRGVTIPENSRVLALLASANRDERVYPDPDTFDLFRTFTADNKILAFGEGIHSCVGAPLARLMATIAVQELVVGLDGTEVRVVGIPERWAKQMARGFASLPVKFVSSRPEPQIRKRHITSVHLETVRRKTTTVTLAAREFEADVRVEAKDVVADGVVTLTLREVDGYPLPRWEPGAHVDLILDHAPTRQYSLCGDRADPHVWRLGILRDPDGRGSSLYVHDRLQPGDTMRVRGPRNNFPLVASPRYLFIAGGIGITPILPMIASAEAAGAEWELVYGGRQRASMAFLDELARYGDRVSVRPQDETGLLDLESILGTPQPDTLIYCCGPEPLLAAVEEHTAGWPPRSLHVERFAAKPVTEPVLAGAFEVFLAQSELTLTVPPERSILDVVEDAGISVLSSCREGTCGTCEAAVLEGQPDHRDSVLTAEERAANDCMMICISRSRIPRLVLDL